MKNLLERSWARVLAGAVLALLTGCATTQMNAAWRDPSFVAGPLQGWRVLVVCRAPDEALRRVCEDQLSNQLSARGVVAAQSYSITGFPWASADASDELRAAARASGVAALASMSLYPGELAVAAPGAQIGVGVSGGGYRGGGISFGGLGISIPIGGTTPTQSLIASSSLVELAGGKLVWSGQASTPASGDSQAQVGALTQIMIEALGKAGLI
jgi:hypothetical protein